MPTSPTPPVPAPGSTPAAAAAGARAPGSKGASQQSKTAFSTMEEIRVHEPELYDAMAKGIAQTIINDLRRHAERLKKLMREGQRRD